MISKEFFKNLNEVAEQRDLAKEDIYEIIKKALVYAYKKAFGDDSCKITLNPDKQEINIYKVFRVVDHLSDEVTEDSIKEILVDEARKFKGKSNAKVGQIIEIPVTIDELGRQGASQMKSMFNQSLKQLEREKAEAYFKNLEGEMIQAKVVDVKDDFLILNIGRNLTTFLPKKELLINDNFQVGDFVRVFIKKVEHTNKEPKVYVTRNDRNLINRLLETYIPEIATGVIEVKGIARDPGDRCKIAVYSNDPNVEAIGACVGEGGERIKEIINALNGEKIDLYKWSPNIEETIANSLQPATVTKVLNVDPKTKTSIVIVPDDELSLAIGKSGQNVRLAVQSCGWKIDIKSLKEAFDEGLVEL